MTGRQRTALVLGEWFGCGRAPIAPGTVGSLGALPVYFLVRSHGAPAILAAALVITLVGIWAGGVVEEMTGVEDPQNVVIDEVAGTLLALAAAPPTWPAIVVAFVAFRAFDMLKPWPVSAAERLPGGFGIMLDDVAAGGLAALVVLGLHAARVV